jgi:hypothetical protein
MILSEHKDLKYALTALPVKDKDKLLLRLIAKDKILTEHLHFKLLEDESDLEDRRSALLEEINIRIAELTENARFNSKDTLLVLRALNGKISHHYKVTKHVNSEIELRVHLLNQMPIAFNDGVYSPLSKYNERLVVYFVRATLAAYKKYLKLHEDLQFDLQTNFNTLLNKVHSPKLAYTAEAMDVPQSI